MSNWVIQKFSMIKNLVYKNQALTLYLLSNIVIILVLSISIFTLVYGQESFSCYNSMGSFSTHTCSLSEYLYDHIFWVVLAIVSAQVALIPATIITYLLMKYIQIKYKGIQKKRLWLKYLFALSIYAISIITIIKVAESFWQEHNRAWSTFKMTLSTSCMKRVSPSASAACGRSE